MVFGGSRMARPGFFFEPTVVANLPDEARLVMEEQFGPILPVLPYDSLDEAISRANDTRFGLGASVWTGDATRGALVADMLEAGMTWVNAHGLIGFPAQSGVASELKAASGACLAQPSCALLIEQLRNNEQLRERGLGCGTRS